MPLYQFSHFLLFVLVLSLPSCTPPQEQRSPYSGDWTVMGTNLDITVYLHESKSARAEADLRAAYEAVAEIDRLMSLYRTDSEITALNKSAGSGAVPVSAPLYGVLEAAEHYAALSNGSLDVTVQPLVDLWGFFKVETASVPSSEEIKSTLQRVGRDRLNLNPMTQTAMLASGSGIDLGAIAKGFAVDRAIGVLRVRGVQAALVNLGGTIGVLGDAPGDRPWVVGIKHPRDAHLIGEVRLRHGAVATSGDYDRYFVADGKRYSHVLDPRSGWPVEGLYALTVVAPNGTAADALSTAAFVLGPDEGMALLSDCKDVSGFLVEPGEDQNNGNANILADRLTVRVTPNPESGPTASDKMAPFRIDPDPNVTVAPFVGTRNKTEDQDCVWSAAP